MAADSAVSVVGYFFPIFAFLLVFIIIYAVLFKSKVLGDNNGIMLFISFILASFFIVESSLVTFVVSGSAFFAVAAMVIFFLMALVGFLPGENPLGIFSAKGWTGWTVLGIAVAFFIISSSYIFNWAINWSLLQSWLDTEWFGMVLLLLVAGLVSFVITRNAS